MGPSWPKGPIRVRPGRRASLVGAIAAAIVMFSGMGMGAPAPFALMGLLIIGASLFNAFSREGIPEWEIETPPGEKAPAVRGNFCTACGHAIDGDDRFCAGCGAAVGNP